MYLFNAKIENPEKLEKMLVGRAHIVDALVSAQLSHINSGMPPQYLVIGPRGSGKTHILRIVYDRLSKNIEFMATHEIAYMVEDETGIGSYFDLLQRIFEAIKRWSNDTQKNQFIAEQVEILKDIHPNQWAKSAEQILMSILKDKSLLVLIENFDSILRGIDKKNDVAEIAKLRDFVQQHNQLSFIATSQSLINALSDNQNPLYGFFNIIQLKRLTLDESFEYVKKVALAENNDELVQFLETHDGKGHLEAIHQFTKGNHRLLLVFFDFLKAEFRSNLSDVFLKSIDELKPYYESFIRNLAPQQQKIVQYLCLQRIPQKGTDIGRNCFLDRNTVSKQLSELQLLGYVSAVNEKGRNKYYEINEPLLRMCIEINEDRNGIIKLFVNFLGQLYTAEQLKEKYLHYNFLGRFQPEPIQKLYQSEAKFYEMVRSQFLADWKLNEEEKIKLDLCCEPEEAKEIIQDLSSERSIASEVMNKITRLIELNEWEKINDFVQNQLKVNPRSFELYSILATSYQIDEQFDKAIESFLKAIEINSDDEDLWYSLGNCYSENKEYNKAIESFLKAIEINSENEKTWNNLGASYSENKQYEKAILAYLKAIEINPDDEIAWSNLGYLYNDIEKYDEAINAHLKAIEIKPDDGELWFDLGYSYSNTKQYIKSIEAYCKYLEINPEYEPAWFNLGNSYLELKQYEKAIEAYEKAINLKPEDEDAYFNLGNAYLDVGLYDKAIATNLAAIKINPNEVEFWNSLGVAYSDVNQYENAINAFLNAIKTKSDDQRLWFNLGNSYGKIKQHENAINAFLKAIEFVPEDSGCWNNLGNVYYEARLYDEAISAYLKAINIESKVEGYWYNLANSYNKISQYEKAIDAYNKAIELNPSRPEVLNNLGIIYYKLSNLDKAKDNFIKAISCGNDKRGETTSWSYSNLIEIQFALKEHDNALSSIDNLFSKIERLEYITELEDALVLLCKENSEDAVKEVFNKLLQICIANNATEKLSALLSNVVFRILREYKELKPFRIELLQHILEELFGNLPEFTYPLRYLNIGIRYFLKDEKEAIYEMSQEERAVFEKFTSTDLGE